MSKRSAAPVWTSSGPRIADAASLWRPNVIGSASIPNGSNALSRPRTNCPPKKYSDGQVARQFVIKLILARLVQWRALGARIEQRGCEFIKQTGRPDKRPQRSVYRKHLGGAKTHSRRGQGVCPGLAASWRPSSSLRGESRPSVHTLLAPEPNQSTGPLDEPNPLPATVHRVGNTGLRLRYAGPNGPRVRKIGLVWKSAGGSRPTVHAPDRADCKRAKTTVSDRLRRNITRRKPRANVGDRLFAEVFVRCQALYPLL